MNNEYLNSLHIGDTFHNDNGEDYIVIATNKKNDEAFLGRYYPQSNQTHYIVAWGIRKGSWCQGHYFMSDFKNACEYFNRKEG